MKNIKVTIVLDMEVPDDWEVVDHPDEIQAFKMTDGRCMYMSFLPMFSTEFHEQSTWTDESTDELTNEILEMVTDEHVTMKQVSN